MNANTPEGSISPSLSPMSNACPAVSKQLLSLTGVDDQPKVLDDSFSSIKDSRFNKGATAFLALVEKSLAEYSVGFVKFDQLVLQMMDLGVNKKVCTASDNPDVLSNQGWSKRQV